MQSIDAMLDGLPQEDLERLHDMTDEQIADLIRQSSILTAKQIPYLTFLRDTLPKSWAVNVPHIRLIAEHLDAALRGEVDRLAFFMPPRHGKSETITYRFPLRWMEANPGHNALVTGYNERFARKFGRRTRNIAATRGMVAADKTAADEWEMTTGGLYMARGVGSPPTGTGFGLICIDDPIRRREDAESEVYREKVWDWYTDDLTTRLEPGGIVVLVMTLWHEDDLGFRAIASEPDKWTVCKLPAIAEDADDAIGREIGEALWPDRYSFDDLMRRKAVMSQNEGERSWNALYQQRPSALEGDIFKVSQISYCEPHEVPQLIRRCRAWDIAATEGGGDWTAGGSIGSAINGKIYVTGLVRGQWSTDNVDDTLLETARADGYEVDIHIPEDPGSAGKKASASYVRLLSGYSITTERISGDKVTRARPFSSQVNAGNVVFVRGHWNAAAIEELRSFPNGKHDDIVDALSDGFSVVAIPATDSAVAGGERQIVAAMTSNMARAGIATVNNAVPVLKRAGSPFGLK